MAEHIHMLSDIHWEGMRYFADCWAASGDRVHHWWDSDRIVVERYVPFSERAIDTGLARDGLSIIGAQLITRFDGCIFVRGFVRLGMFDQHLTHEDEKEVSLIRRHIDHFVRDGVALMSSEFGRHYLSGDFRVQLDDATRALVIESAVGG